MPRTPWRRPRTTDSPRPAGRRWAGRLRRGGSAARQALLVRVGRRSRDVGRAATATQAEVIYTGTEIGRGRTLALPGTGHQLPAPPVIDAEGAAPALLPGPRTA
ncbi:MAG TPA: CDP-alcohol phosphatidyltransferase, partial [Actinoplanes sp.]|nr:CDP-alcohol phosphatidyltransferase [Actinoplanes sp.]